MIDWDAYHAEQPDFESREILRRITNPILPDLRQVLEVGCGRGENLEAWWPEAEAVGVEPNQQARKQALDRGYIVENAEATRLPFGDGEFDLAFTAGVLIHLNPHDLDLALSELHRVSRKYLLAVEYPARYPLAVEYRGAKEGIWKRNYGHEYMDRFPLDLIDNGSGMLWPFDGCAWWLLRKS